MDETMTEIPLEGEQPAPDEETDSLVDESTVEDTENLVPELMADQTKAAWLKKRASAAVRLVKADIESKQDWMDMREESVKLFAGLVAKMKYPAAGARAPHDPIVCRTILQMWTRGREQLLPPKGDLIQVLPVGPEDEEAAIEREDHMNWQFRHKVPNYVAGVADSYLQFLMAGSVFRERYYNSSLKVTCFDPLTADDITVSYALKDVDPLMRRVPRVTRHLRYYRWEIEDLERTGALPPGTTAKLYAKGTGSAAAPEQSNLEKQAQQIDGVVPPSTTVSTNEDGDSSALREFYRCHMWMKLPGETRQRAVSFTVDVATMTPLVLKVREKDDPFDKQRFEADQKVFDLAVQNIQGQYQQQLAQIQQIPGAPVPPEPKLPDPPKPVAKIPRFDVIHYRLFPNPHGFYGIGVAYLLTNANEMVNQLEAEYLLAARFANLRQGFLPKGALGPRGELRLEMGKWIQTELEANEMAGIREFAFQAPSEGLRKVIEQIKGDAYSLVADIDTLTGQAGPTNETKAAAEQRMSNATALMTAVTALWLETFALEPKMLAEDNGLYMPENEPYWVTAPDKQNPDQQVRQQKTASRAAYANEFDFTFTADQRLQTQPERVATATNLISSLTNSPYAQDPTTGPPLFYAAFLRLFKALDLPDMQKALGQPPQPPAPPPPPSPMSQEQENQMFMNEQDHPVLPDDNNEEHLLVLDEFVQSPFYGEMSSTGKQLVDRHHRAHAAALYGAATTQGDQNGQRPAGSGAPAGMGNAGGPGGMGEPGDDSGVPGPAPGGPQPGAQPPAGPVQ